MRHLADEPARRVARHARVGIEREHVAHALRHPGSPAGAGDVGGVGGAAQQPIQFLEFAALALPAHPALFALAPHAPAMQQQEALAGRRRTVAPVQPRDAENGDVEQCIVIRAVFARGIQPVRQQGEMQLLVGRGEVVDLQPVQVFFDGGARIQQHRHGDQRAQFGRDTVAQRQTRQAAGSQAASHRAIDQRDGDFHGRQRRRAGLTTTASHRGLPPSASAPAARPAAVRR